MQNPTDGLLTQLQDAAKGLLYPSETDAEFTCFVWQNMREMTVEKLLVVTRHDRNTPVDGVELEEFFVPLTLEEEWFDDHERSIAARFDNLQMVLEDLLTDISVYRVGTVNIDIYIVGKTREGYYAGVATRAVET